MKRFPTIIDYSDGFSRIKLNGVEWLGVRIVDQNEANDQIPKLLRTEAAKRFVNYEPTGPVDFHPLLSAYGCDPYEGNAEDVDVGIDWLIVGGESGHSARPCDVAWIRSAVIQCKEAGVPCFVKQLGARPYECRGCGACDMLGDDPGHCRANGGECSFSFRSRNGSNPSEWPEDLRVREVPT
jgi:protein gp37